jgi:DNA sulfur modification protein DndB
MAIDDETAVVVECRARQSRGRRSLQREIEEFEGTKKKISSAIRSESAKTFNPKIVWVLATSNIISAEKDVERADAANIRIITENELQYFEAFVAHIGTAGRYQFLAEFLQGQEIPNLQNVRVPAVKGRFGAHTYYSFVVSARHLLKIAFVNHQALNHPDGRPAYQRMINKKRIGEIGSFIESCSPGPYLELFARGVRKNWLVWGNQADDSYMPTWKTYANHSQARLIAAE